MHKLLIKGDKESSTLVELVNRFKSTRPEVDIEIVDELPEGSSPIGWYGGESLYNPPEIYEFIKNPLYEAEPMKSGKERRRERRALERKSKKNHAKKISPIG